MFVKPAPGLVIKCPIILDVLPPEGREVEASDYWTRAVRDGDVVVAAAKDAPVVSAPDLHAPEPGDEHVNAGGAA